MTEVLIIKPSSLGDIIHGLQVAQSLKEQAEVRITWVVREIFASIVEHCDTVDEVLIFERKGGLSGFRRLVKQIRSRTYDYVWDMQGLARSGLLMASTRAAQKIGRSDAREGAQWAAGQRVPLPATGKESHAIEILLPFLSAMDLQPALKGNLTFQPSASLPEGVTVAQAKGSVLLFPGSRRAEKEWGGFAALTERILSEQSARNVFWLGHEACQHREDWPQDRFFNLTQQTQLPDLVTLMQDAALVVANDSGPMHLAAALGVPVVAIFGPTAPERFGPYPLSDPKHSVVQAPNGDLSALSVDEVLPAVLNFL